MSLLLTASCIGVVDAPIPSAGRYESMIFIELGDGLKAEAVPTTQNPTFAIDRVEEGAFRYALLYDLPLSSLRIRTGTISLVAPSPGTAQLYSQFLPSPSLVLGFSVLSGNDHWSRLEGVPDFLEELQVQGWPPDRCAAAMGCYPDSTAERIGYCAPRCSR